MAAGAIAFLNLSHLCMKREEKIIGFTYKLIMRNLQKQPAVPTSGYEYANGPDIELYISPDPQNAKFEVWIPVVKPVKK